VEVRQRGRGGEGRALTVPTSAVSTTNGSHFVTVLANGKTTSVRVEVGVVGAQTTQITSGLQRGQTVVPAPGRVLSHDQDIDH
jgi:multidrug efflux pump subunit AcrA (membrane-fusion protein)